MPVPWGGQVRDSRRGVTGDDQFGSGTSLIGPAALEFAGPTGTATVSARLREGDSVLVCGLTGA